MCILIVMHHAKDAISQYPCSTPVSDAFYGLLWKCEGRQRDRGFKGMQPRQVRSKAANGGYADIRLRERGTKKVHIFTGERKQVKKSKGGPAWMPDKIWKPVVKKVGMEKLENLETATAKVVVIKRRK